MRYFLSTAMLVGMTVSASAAAVPEIDALAGTAALSVVAAVGALIWERRRR